MSEVKKSILKKPKSPIKRKPSLKTVDKVLKITPETEKVDIPTLQDETEEEYDNEIYDNEVEDELLSYGYIPLSNINIQNDRGEISNQYVKAVNKMGQKVYILLDDSIQNLDSDLTLIETKNGNILPHSLKNGALKMAAMDTSGVMFECDQGGLCVLSNVMDDENLTSTESNFTFVQEKNPSSTVVENYGCHMSYPVVKLSEIRVNNHLVIDGSNMVTRKLRNAAYAAYLQDIHHVQDSIVALQTQNTQFVNLAEVNAMKLNETLATLEEWNQHYINNPPTTECDIKKHNLIIHNMRIRNDYIAYLICGMKRVAEYKPQIDKLISNIAEFNDFFNNQFDNLDMATNI